MPGNPFTDPNWAPDLADTVERVVGKVRTVKDQHGFGRERGLRLVVEAAQTFYRQGKALPVRARLGRRLDPRGPGRGPAAGSAGTVVGGGAFTA